MSDFFSCLEPLFEAQSVASSVLDNSIIINRPADIQMQGSCITKTIQEYVDQVYIPYISIELQDVSHFDLVWDSYKEWII